MTLNINASSLNISQNQTSHYNKNVKGSQEKDDVDKASSNMMLQKQKAAEAMFEKEDGLITEVSEQGDTATFSKEGLDMAKGGIPKGDTTPPSTESSSKDLSSYSDAQLKTMLSKGEITQAEYIQEKASRSTESLNNEESMISQLIDISEYEEDK